MSTALKREQGFSLPEVLISVVLLILVITSMSGLQRNFHSGMIQLAQYRQLWRLLWSAAGQAPVALPDGWQLTREKTIRQRCVSITVTIVAPSGRRGTLSRLHCPQR